MQHVSLWTSKPLAAFLSRDCGSLCYTADLAKASPGEGSWLWCLTPSFRRIAWAFGGKRKEHIITATVMKNLFTTREKLCFLSLHVSFLFKSAWHACEHAVPVRQTPLRRMLAQIIVQRRRRPLCRAAGPHRRKNSPPPLEHLASSSESLPQSSIRTYIALLRTKQELSKLGLPLWGVSIDQIKRCRSKLKRYVSNKWLTKYKIICTFMVPWVMKSRMVWNWFFLLLCFCLNFNSGNHLM